MLWDFRELEEYSIDELHKEIEEIDIMNLTDSSLELRKLQCKELIRAKKIDKLLD
jgi:hypothetical protein